MLNKIVCSLSDYLIPAVLGGGVTAFALLVKKECRGALKKDKIFK